MNALLTANWKRAQELASERDKLNNDLLALQDELRHLSTAVSKKVAAKEAVVAELLRLQDSTAKLVSTGEWVMKEVPVVQPGVPTSGQVAILSKSLDTNPVWNFIKNALKSAWDFLFNRPKKVAVPQKVAEAK